MPNAADRLAATMISQAETSQAIADRDSPSQAHPSTMQRSHDSIDEAVLSVPLDQCELEDA
ncbi:hypothetical protein [Rubripirellula reticaptiva]|uniref:Uncharacterized protein n=1 Tax=Rubripirellula reticaptiva TaxID=2528013 RepID=A0A5C6F719_9BACT|nr:hypothetical protein [Rubripirellula reticaptiva]TWU55896.1 hypothetical protein Poly59_21990 [Rubripirellula reticaptiva]